ncbi:MAG: hypothetical protein ACREJC_17255 [Tepidisphaeraceae bacterium]
MVDKKNEPVEFDLADLAPPPAAVPSLVGLSVEQLQTILGALGKTSAEAMREAYRLQRKENPNYPERSVFNPAGVFDDEGKAIAPKTKLTRPTFFVGVRLSEELMTVDEIDLCNRFSDAKFSRDGNWKAEFVGQGRLARLMIDVPCKTVDDRMTLPPFTHILRELLDGTDAVSPEALQKRVETLEAQLRHLQNRAA